MQFDDLRKLGKTVSKFAPLLGAILPIPGGEMIGSAIKEAFADPDDDINTVVKKIEADPNAKVKLQQIMSEERVAIEQLTVEKLQAHQAEMANARQREIELKDKTPSYIALIFVLGYMIMMLVVIFTLKFFTLNGFEEKILEVMLASLSSAVMFILAYYFGASNNKS